jgi:hypothetical protein
VDLFEGSSRAISWTLAGTPSQRGSDWMTAAMIDDTSSPSNARRPVSIS